jgi:hypothetical protein
MKPENPSPWGLAIIILIMVIIMYLIQSVKHEREHVASLDIPEVPSNEDLTFTWDEEAGVWVLDWHSSVTAR